MKYKVSKEHSNILHYETVPLDNWYMSLETNIVPSFSAGWQNHLQVICTPTKERYTTIL